jgi:hypothetical protein
MAVETTRMQRDDVASTTGKQLLRIQAATYARAPGALWHRPRPLWMTSLILQDKKKNQRKAGQNHLFQLRLQFKCFRMALSAL